MAASEIRHDPVKKSHVTKSIVSIVSSNLPQFISEDSLQIKK